MSWPAPFPGLVIRYVYLWATEAETGRDEGSKERPCAVIITTRDSSEKTLVRVLPITHSPPGRFDDALEIPSAIKRRLGLDGERSWIVLSESNDFRWPGPDLRPAKSGDTTSVIYGVLPPGFFNSLKAKLEQRRPISPVYRTE